MKPVVFALLLAACAGPATRGAPSPTTSHPRADVTEGPSGALGFTLGQSVREVVAAHPELSFSANRDEPTATGTVEHRGRTFDVYLSFLEGRLATIGGHATPSSLREHEALARELEQVLGEGAPSLCTSEVGPALPAYLASGRGSVRREWDGGVRASVSLTPLTEGRLQLRVSVADAALVERHPADLDLKSAKVTRPPPACGTLDLPEALGFSFGSSAQAVRGLLGTDVDGTRYGATVPHRLEGVDGDLELHFYQGCLAVVMFQAEGTNVDYDALQRALLTALGEPERRERCSPDGEAPTDVEVSTGQGSRQTLWRGGALEGSVRLSRRSDGEPVRVTLEINATALAPYAPHIDF